MSALNTLWRLIDIPLLFLAVFLILYKINRASLAPSFFFTGFLFSAAGIAALHMYHSDSAAAKVILVFLMILFFLIAAFGIYALIGFLLLNARAVLKRETRTPAHCLTLILALALIAYLIFIWAANLVVLPSVLQVILFWIEALVFCYAVHVTQFMVAVVLCNLSRPPKNQDYIIVHGAGLREGNVSPLLARRVERAIAFYERQKKERTPPKLLLSGGRGPDEPRSEAEAMAEYAQQKGVPPGDILLEAQSVNTLENMRFSKRIMEEAAFGKPYRAIYVTSNYHLLRTGIYARQVGLKINGLGAKTALYYLPVALLREYIAYIVMHRKRNIAFAVFSFLCSCALIVLMLYFR